LVYSINPKMFNKSLLILIVLLLFAIPEYPAGFNMALVQDFLAIAV